MTLNLYPTTTVAAAGPHQNLCNTTSGTLAANAAAGSETGSWTTISGTGSASSVNSETSAVTGLTIGGTTVLRWTITSGFGGCVPTTSDVTINVDPTTTVAAAGPDQNLCNTTSGTLAANAAAGSETGTWTTVSGTGSATSVNSETSAVTGLTIGGTTVLRWTITSGFGGCAPTTSDVTINVDPTTTVAAAGPLQNLCNTTSGTLAANAAAGSETGSWTTLSATGSASPVISETPALR